MNDKLKELKQELEELKAKSKELQDKLVKYICLDKNFLEEAKKEIGEENLIKLFE